MENVSLEQVWFMLSDMGLTHITMKEGTLAPTRLSKYGGLLKGVVNSKLGYVSSLKGFRMYDYVSASTELSLYGMFLLLKQADQDILSHVSMFRQNLQMFLNNLIIAP